MLELARRHSRGCLLSTSWEIRWWCCISTLQASFCFFVYGMLTGYRTWECIHNALDMMHLQSRVAVGVIVWPECETRTDYLRASWELSEVLMYGKSGSNFRSSTNDEYAQLEVKTTRLQTTNEWRAQKSPELSEEHPDTQKKCAVAVIMIRTTRAVLRKRVIFAPMLTQRPSSPDQN